MPAVGKVVALITRLGARGPEVCVFEHPLAGVQLPAGTLHPGEDPIAGALREGFEETGLEGLTVTRELARLPASKPGTAVLNRAVTIGERTIPPGYLAHVIREEQATSEVRIDGSVGVIETGALTFDATRHVVHISFDAPAPDEWWVLTPDGGGLAWRCFWLPVDEAGRLGTWQQDWLEAAREPLLRAPHAPARRRPVHDPGVPTDLTVEVFFAPPFGGERVQISWLEPEYCPPDATVGRAEVVPFTRDGRIVTVAGENEIPGLPGGHREDGESLEDTLRRELREEACAEVEEFELIGYQRFRYLLGGEVERVTLDALYWARVRVDQFVPRFETTTRTLVTPDEALAHPFWAQPLSRRQVDRGLAAEKRYADRLEA